MHYSQEFDFHEIKIRIETDCEPLAARLGTHWLTKCWTVSAKTACDVKIKIEKAGTKDFQSKPPLSLPGVAVLASTSNYYASLNENTLPWQGLIQFRRVRDWEGFLLSIFAPFLGHVFRRLNFFELHSGAVALEEHGIILPAKMGSGKTTTVMSLIRSGFKFISDDHLYLREVGEKVEILGFPKDPALLDDSVERFPELHFLKKQEPILRGGRKKKLLPIEQVEKLYGPRRPKAILKTILFPRVALKRRVSLEPLSVQETMLWMMRQEPWDHCGAVRFAGNVVRQMALFRKIAETVQAYMLFLNPNITEIPRKVRETILATPTPVKPHALLQAELAV